MGVHAGVMGVILVLGGLHLLFSALEPICPQPCDYQQHQHVLCTISGLRNLPKDSTRLPSLEDILIYSLGRNFISNISAFDLPCFSRLQRLDLQYNQIRNIHPKAFQKRVSVEELYLGNNLLPGLVPAVLTSLLKLRVLNLNGNELSMLSWGCFYSLASLVKLRLDRNLLQGLLDALFSLLENLLYLHLENNRLRTMGRNVFSGLGRLRLLNLSSNLLRSLHHWATFHPLTALVLLGNQLQQVAGQVLRP